MSDQLQSADRRRASDREIADLRDDVAELKAEMKLLKASVDGLVTAWTTAKGLVTFVKFMVAIGAGLATIVGIIKSVK